ncbi:hypothetical protein PssvBMR4_gp09c [Pseudomonas phage MR4]|uniref:Uncharacterized protein n=1 Tax=Pseudomonas phage MR4 TaxID=2711171 RepID=A0A6M3T8X8_9CAUD|nr:hypothetical protein PssvBMR4_gp09c [Pseudomonas phage MR4]
MLPIVVPKDFQKTLNSDGQSPANFERIHVGTPVVLAN